MWVFEICPFPLLWPLAYTTACTTIQDMVFLQFGIILHRDLCLVITEHIMIIATYNITVELAA